MQEIFNNFMRITDGIAMSDVLTWIFTVFAGIVAYKVIDYMQTSMARHGMLKDVEDSFTKLFNSPIAKALDSEGVESTVFVRSVLHDDMDWQVIRNENKGIEFKIVENQRFIHIRNGKGKTGQFYDEWISTQALHEINLKCRRIEKMFKDDVIKRIDLADMFRELLPLGKSGRLEFFKAYYGDYDAECIAYLVMQTLVSCNKYKNDTAVAQFAAYYKAHPDIHTLFESNRRYRRVRDYLTYRKFMKLCKQ